MPNVFNNDQPIPVPIKHTKIAKLWDLLLEADDDDPDAEEDEKIESMKSLMSKLMPKEWWVLQ